MAALVQAAQTPKLVQCIEHDRVTSPKSHSQSIGALPIIFIIE